MILLGAWPSLALSTPPSLIAKYGWVTPKATFEGRLLRVLNDGIVVTVQDAWSFGEPSADRRILRYWDLEFGMTDTLDLLPLIQGQYSRLAMSPDGELLAVMFDDSVNVSILRLDTGEVVSSFLDDQAKPDRQRHMEFSDGGRMLALNNKTRGVNYWRVSDGALAEVRHNTSISSSVAVSPDWRTFSYTNGVQIFLVDRKDSLWTVKLHTDTRRDFTRRFAGGHELDVGRINYFPDGLLLAGSQQDFADYTWVWDLVPFPPITLTSAEAVVTDSLGNPVEGLSIRLTHELREIYDGAMTDNFFFHAVTDENGRVPLIVPIDSSYDVETFYRWEDSGIDWTSLGSHLYTTRWRGIPLKRDTPFTLNLSLVGGLYGRRPWEITYTATAEATPDFNGDGVTDLSDFFLFAEAFGGTDPRFDLNGDGSVDLADFLLFAESFGQPQQAKLVALARERLGLPDGPQLQQNAPNPFNSGTIISWFQLQPGSARLEVFALTGQRMAVLHEGRKEAGSHRLRWDGRDERGRSLASGVYVYRLVTREGVQTRKLTLLR